MHPELFQTKYFTLNTLWIFFAFALIVSIYIFIKLSVKNGLKIQFLSEHSWELILWAIIGGRIACLIQNHAIYFYEFSFKSFLHVFYIWDKGLNLWGAVTALLLYLFYLCEKHEQDFWKWLDVIIPAVILGLAIGSLGEFFEGTNYGKPTSLPWGVNFESPAVKYTVPIHPTQIYAFIYCSAIAVGLILAGRTEKILNLKKVGFIGIVGIGAYSFLKFLELFARGDDMLTLLGIKIPQIIAFIIAIGAGIFLYLRYKNLHFKQNK